MCLSYSFPTLSFQKRTLPKMIIFLGAKHPFSLRFQRHTVSCHSCGRSFNQIYRESFLNIFAQMPIPDSTGITREHIAMLPYSQDQLSTCENFRCSTIRGKNRSAFREIWFSVKHIKHIQERLSLSFMTLKLRLSPNMAFFSSSV